MNNKENKMKMKKLTIVAIAALALAGCGKTDGAESGVDRTPDTHYTFYQQLPGGGEVLCVWAKSGYGGGLSCDWANQDARVAQ